MDHKLQIVLAARDATKSAFMSAQGRVKAFTKSVFSLRGAMVATAGAAAMGAMIKKSLETADAIGKAADVIGISTDALQEYRHAARIAGVSTSLMDNSFKAFSKRVGEARNETGALVTFLKKFDEQLLKNIQNAGSTEEALNLFMDRMGRTADQTDRAALAAAAFSRSGLVLTNMVKDGAAGLEKMRQEARDLGIVMDEQLIRQSEKANDEIEKLTRVLKVQFMSAAVGLAPEIAKLAENTTNWWKANQDVVKQDVAGWVSGVTEAIKIGIKPLQIWADLWKRIGYKAGGGSAVRGMDYKGTLNDRVDKALSDFYKDLEPTKTTIISTGGGTAGADTAGGLPGWAKDFKPGFDFDMMNRELAEHVDLMKEVKAAEDEFAESMIIAGGTGEIMAEQLRRGVGDSVQAFKDGYSVLENLSQRTAEAMEQNFSDFYFDVMRNEFDDLGDYADAMLRSIQRATADVMGQITKEALFGGGSSGSSGLITEIGKWIGGMFGGGGTSGTLGGLTEAQTGGALFHSGGRVGMTPTPMRSVPASLFAHAPRLHQGLAGDEFPAILQKGETVYAKGSGPSIQVNVINESNEPLQADQGQVRFDGQKYITEVHIDKMINSRSYRQANRQAMR